MKVRMFSPFISEEAIERVCQTLRSGYIGEGPVVEEFENKFKTFLNIPYALAVTSGTTALHLTLALAGISPGDEVITSAQTMMATSHVILAHYAKPVFADIQYFTGNISPFTGFSFQAIQQITTGEGGMLCALREDDFKSAHTVISGFGPLTL